MRPDGTGPNSVARPHRDSLQEPCCPTPPSGEQFTSGQLRFSRDTLFPSIPGGSEYVQKRPGTVRSLVLESETRQRGQGSSNLQHLQKLRSSPGFETIPPLLLAHSILSPSHWPLVRSPSHATTHHRRLPSLDARTSFVALWTFCAVSTPSTTARLHYVFIYSHSSQQSQQSPPHKFFRKKEQMSDIQECKLQSFEMRYTHRNKESDIYS